LGTFIIANESSLLRSEDHANRYIGASLDKTMLPIRMQGLISNKNVFFLRNAEVFRVFNVKKLILPKLNRILAHPLSSLGPG
jgi:hypothetical protein